MERKLLGVFETEKAIVRIYAGPMTDTQEKLRKLIEPAARKFYADIRKSEAKKQRMTHDD